MTIDPRSNPRGRAVAEEGSVRGQLEAAAGDLVYSSESDRPFEFFSLPVSGAVAAGPLTAARFAEVAGVGAGVPVEERALDAFFARHIEATDPFDTQTQALRPRYEALKATLRHTLRDVRVFRVGRVEVRCYVAGWAPDGSLSGLVTTAIET